MFFGYENMAHESSGNPQLEADKRQYLNFSFDPSHGAIEAYWESCYRGISKANYVINNRAAINAVDDPNFTQATKDKFIGEAKFLRGFYYMLLVTRFGDIPLRTTMPSDANGLPKTAAAVIWDTIYADLQFATQNCLEKSVEQTGRATVGAAWAMLGKAYLYNERYDDAMAAFNHVYNQTGANAYSLESRFLNNFEEETEHGPESFFEIEFDPALGHGDKWNSDRSGAGLNEITFRGQEYGWNDWFNTYPSNDLLDEYEAGDPRYSYSFYSAGDTYVNGTLTIAAIPQGRRAGWRKYENYYKAEHENAASGINFRVIRYSDVLLMMAECEANRAGGNLTTAVAYMNEVRARADVDMPLYGTPAMDAIYPVNNLANFMIALEHERKVELCGEQVRINDLIRWGRLEAFMEEVFPSLPSQEKEELVFLSPKNLLWPIPQKEIDANQVLTNADQNFGY
jgi:hypothetical protein